jgi:MFS family permease
MPSFADWIKASWADYRRRWAVLLGVAGTSGACALLGGFLPFVPAGLLTAAGVGPAWAVWGLASLVAVLVVLWASTWAQAAVTRAALTDDAAAACLKRGWAMTGAFGWVLTLTMLAVAGGWVLLIVPGLLLSVLFFLAPMIVASGEATGLPAMALSWGRVKPRFGLVATRIVAAGLIAAAPGWLPYIGWLIAMFWTPFGLVLVARLEKDLRAADPTPAVPSGLGAAIAALSLIFIFGTAAAAFTANHLIRSEIAAYGGPEAIAARVHPESAQAYVDALGRGDDEGAKKALAEVLSQLRTAPPAADGGTPQAVVSTATLSGTTP